MTIPAVAVCIGFASGNRATAVATAASLRASVDRDRPGDAGVILVLETSEDRGNPEVAAALESILAAGWNSVHLWDARTTRLVLAGLPAGGPLPFHDGFSYGGAVNRMMLMSSVARADIMIRFDPGTAAPPDKSFAEWVRPATERLRNGTGIVAVSGAYAGRTAVRIDNVVPGKQEEWLDLLSRGVGRDVRRQLAGGAMFAMPVGPGHGTPLIPFAPYHDAGRQLPTLVWGSDDGFLQMTHPSRTEAMPECVVPRVQSVGMPKRPTEYFLGIAGAVMLESLRAGESAEAASARLDDFIAEFNRRGLLDAANPANGGISALPAGFVPQAFREQVAAGWANFRRLTCGGMWERVSQHAAEIARRNAVDLPYIMVRPPRARD